MVDRRIITHNSWFNFQPKAIHSKEARNWWKTITKLENLIKLIPVAVGWQMSSHKIAPAQKFNQLNKLNWAFKSTFPDAPCQNRANRVVASFRLPTSRCSIRFLSHSSVTHSPLLPFWVSIVSNICIINSGMVVRFSPSHSLAPTTHETFVYRRKKLELLYQLGNSMIFISSDWLFLLKRKKKNRNRNDAGDWSKMSFFSSLQFVNGSPKKLRNISIRNKFGRTSPRRIMTSGLTTQRRIDVHPREKKRCRLANIEKKKSISFSFTVKTELQFIRSVRKKSNHYSQ